jgi:hypothetical protein
MSSSSGTEQRALKRALKGRRKKRAEQPIATR